MFTGIVEETGVVERIRPAAKSIELTVRTNLCGRGLKVGASLAINGCCLTVVKVATRGRFNIDGIGRITRWERMGQDHVLDIAAPAEVMRYIVFKGSMAVDGISLTVAGVGRKSFRIWIIPHTYEVTALRERKTGDAVNLEADLIGKYVEKFVAARTQR